MKTKNRLIVSYKYRQSSIQTAPLVFKSGTLFCDRETEFDFYLPDME